MCAIVTSNDPTAGEAALRLLLHRGPDASSRYITRRGTVFLGHARLACFGGPEAAQPIGDGLGKGWTCVFNGELYNWRSISGTAAATEARALADLPAQTGPEAWRHLDGYYSVAAYHAGSNRLWVGRDPVGVVPLFYSIHSGRFLCASERKAFAGFPGRVREVRAGEWIAWDVRTRRMVARRGPFASIPWLMLCEEPDPERIEKPIPPP